MTDFDRDEQEQAIELAREVLTRVAQRRETQEDDTMTVTYTLNALLMAAYELALMHSIEPEVLTGAVKRNYASMYWASGQTGDSPRH
jgi:hypothetical protein